MLVLDHAHLQPQLHRHPRLALVDPLGVRLENGEDLLGMGDDFALQHPAADLVDLPVGMFQVVVEQRQLQRDCGQAGQLSAGVAQTHDEGFGLPQVVPVRLFDFFLPRLAFLPVLRCGVPEFLDGAVRLLELAEVVGILPPAGQPVRIGQFGAQPEGLADGFVQEVGVGGELDIGLHHKGVTACV